MSEGSETGGGREEKDEGEGDGRESGGGGR